jgi:hypothetical protein
MNENYYDFVENQLKKDEVIQWKKVTVSLPLPAPLGTLNWPG